MLAFAPARRYTWKSRAQRLLANPLFFRGVMHAPDLPASPKSAAVDGPWWRELNRYHWFVFIVCTLGWLFDTMDQQLFNIARTPAVRALASPDLVAIYSGYTTSIFLIGWG